MDAALWRRFPAWASALRKAVPRDKADPPFALKWVSGWTKPFPATLTGTCSSSPPCEQQSGANHDGADARPHGHIHGFLVLHRKFDGAHLRVVRFLGVREFAVHQPEYAGDDQNDCDDLGGAHVCPLRVRKA